MPTDHQHHRQLPARRGDRSSTGARWGRSPEQADDPERVAIRETLAFVGKAVHDQRGALGLSVADLAERAG